MRGLFKKVFVTLLCLLAFSACFAGCSLFGFGSSLWVDTSSAKLTIEQGEEFDYSSVKVYLEKITERVLLTNDQVTFGTVDNTVIGSQRISVEYESLKAFFTVTVTKPATGELLLDRETLPTKLVVGREYDFSAVTASIVKDGSTVELQYTQLTFTGLDNTMEGEQTVTVTYTEGYKEYVATFNVKVYFEVRELRVDLSAIKATYQYFEFDWSKVSVVFYDCGDQTHLQYGQYTHTPIDVMEAGEKVVTVYYGEYETSFTVNVLASTAYIELDLTNVDTIVLLNEPLDLSAIKIIFYIATGEEGVEIPLTDEQLTITLVDTSKLGTTTVTVTYMGRFSATFDVRVADKYIVTFHYLLDGQTVSTEVGVEKNAFATPLSSVATTDELYFVGWFEAGSDTPFDFATPINDNINLHAKYLTKAQYIDGLKTQMKDLIDQAVLQKTGKADYRLTYLEEDYDKLLAMIDNYAKYMTENKSWAQLDALLADFSADLTIRMSSIKTAIERVEEYRQSLNVDSLSEENKKEVQKLFDSALEQMREYDGGAPTLDYIFYLLKLSVDFYFFG